MMDGDVVPPLWLAEAGADGAASSARVIGRGLWGPTIELGDGTLLKLVRRRAGIGDGLDICANEAGVLQLLGGGPIEDLTIPRLISHGVFGPATEAARAGYGAWLRMTRVPGKPFGEAALAALTAGERDRFGDSFGRAIAVFQAGARRIAGHRLASLDLRVAALLRTLPEASPEAADRALCAALMDAVDAMPVDRRNCFVHADSHLENLMVDNTGRVCGFVDLAEAGRGFPEIDLAYLHWLPEIAEPVRRSYAAIAGPIDDDAYQLAGAIYALTGAIIDERRGDAEAGSAERMRLASCLARIGLGRG